MKKKVIICLGSSCFARGNNKNLEIIERYLAENSRASGLVDLRGSCCEQMCLEGPNISIDGRMIHSVDTSMLHAVLGEVCSPSQDIITDVPETEGGAHE